MFKIYIIFFYKPRDRWDIKVALKDRYPHPMSPTQNILLKKKKEKIYIREEGQTKTLQNKNQTILWVIGTSMLTLSVCPCAKSVSWLTVESACTSPWWWWGENNLCYCVVVDKLSQTPDQTVLIDLPHRLIVFLRRLHTIVRIEARDLRDDPVSWALISMNKPSYWNKQTYNKMQHFPLTQTHWAMSNNIW